MVLWAIAQGQSVEAGVPLVIATLLLIGVVERILAAGERLRGGPDER